MSALLAQHLNEPCLVIAPPHLLDEHNPGSWPNVFREFGVRGFLCDPLASCIRWWIATSRNSRTVFIDESHRFRTEDTQSYELLAQITRGKRIVLVSATPLKQLAAGNPEPDQTVPAGQEQHHPECPQPRSLFGQMQQKLKGLDRQRDREVLLQDRSGQRPPDSRENPQVP